MVHSFLQTVYDVFFRLPFASVKDMNKALQEARVTEQDMATFTARLHSDHDNKMLELTFNQVSCR